MADELFVSEAAVKFTWPTSTTSSASPSPRRCPRPPGHLAAEAIRRRAVTIADLRAAAADRLDGTLQASARRTGPADPTLAP